MASNPTDADSFVSQVTLNICRQKILKPLDDGWYISIIFQAIPSYPQHGEAELYETISAYSVGQRCSAVFEEATTSRFCISCALPSLLNFDIEPYGFLSASVYCNMLIRATYGHGKRTLANPRTFPA